MEDNKTVLTNEDFSFLAAEDKGGEEIVRPATTFWKDVMRRLFSSKAAIFSFVIVMFMVVMSVVIPMVSKMCIRDRFRYAYKAHHLHRLFRGFFGG